MVKIIFKQIAALLTFEQFTLFLSLIAVGAPCNLIAMLIKSDGKTVGAAALLTDAVVPFFRTDEQMDRAMYEAYGRPYTTKEAHKALVIKILDDRKAEMISLASAACDCPKCTRKREVKAEVVSVIAKLTHKH